MAATKKLMAAFSVAMLLGCFSVVGWASSKPNERTLSERDTTGIFGGDVVKNRKCLIVADCSTPAINDCDAYTGAGPPVLAMAL